MALAPPKVIYLGFIVLIILLGVEAFSEAGLVQCGQGKFKYCNKVARECPQSCPNQCFIDCASCEPICGSLSESSSDPTLPTSMLQTRRILVEEGNGGEYEKGKGVIAKYEKERAEKEKKLKYEKEKTEKEKYEKYEKEKAEKEKYEKYEKEKAEKEKYEKEKVEKEMYEKYEKEKIEKEKYEKQEKEKTEKEKYEKHEKEIAEKEKYEKYEKEKAEKERYEKSGKENVEKANYEKEKAEKKKEEKEKADKEKMEKEKKEKEKGEREKYEKEKKEKDEREKYEKEKKEKEEREKYEKEKKEKEEREKYEKEKKEKDEREKYEKEKKAKEQREKYEKEKYEREIRERYAREKYERETRERYEREKHEREIRERYEKEKYEKEQRERYEKEQREKFEKEKQEKEKYEKQTQKEKENSKGKDNGDDDSKGSPTTPAHPTSGVKRVRCKNKNYHQCYGQEHVCPSNCASTCEVDCVTCKPVCSCDYPGAVCQDPRFIGGDGITFYFHGKKNKDFCIVSDTNLHINAHFIGKRSSNMTRDFTWVQSLGILFNNHKLFIGARQTATWDDSLDRLALTLDGEPIFLNKVEGSTWHSTTTPLISITRISNTNNVMFNVQGLFKIIAKVVPITAEESRIHNYGITKDDCFAHLDMAFKFYSMGQKVDGVLGRTYKDDYVSKVRMGIAMPVVGGEAEYETSNLFEADCSVSRFQAGALTTNEDSIMDLSSLRCASGMDGAGIICKR